MIKFILEENSIESIKVGYPKFKPVAIVNLTENLRSREWNNIDAWLYEIDKQLFTNSNEEFFGDNVCVFFKDDKVKLINYWDYESGKENYCELTVLELKKMTVEWKWFVIDWEIKVIKGEI
jgi:hypothetical protein